MVGTPTIDQTASGLRAQLESQGQQIHPSIRSQDWSWPFWPVVPLYPYGQRRTLRKEVVKGEIWTFEQIQGVLYVIVPIRMTVIKLSEGGLLVYAPVAPTSECIQLVNELVAAHGDVKYIILPTASGLEHKVFVGPFARRFPNAQVFVSPNQWSFPVNLPLSWLGLPAKRTQPLPTNSSEAPFADQFDYATLGPIDLGLGAFEETALHHKRSRTLLVTDSVISVPTEPPDILQLDPYPLLFHAKDDVFEQVEDTPANRLKGWRRIVLFAIYFRPSALDVISLGQTVSNALKAIDRSKKAYYGVYPWRWKSTWSQSFEALHRGGRLFVAPILQALIFNREPQAVFDWVDTASRWNFQRIIPCHFDSPILTNAHEFQKAFAFLDRASSESSPLADSDGQFLPEEDFKVLRGLYDGLNKLGITPPPKSKK
ncbi:MAG: DUF4336 domain-containing protein [Leptolyngbyaceae cyanobacterium MO_188.B28]|nr:DUF4336 domain-containing protein [Leptolyngbyaceae cyanobacterium MO_188.B28]